MLRRAVADHGVAAADVAARQARARQLLTAVQFRCADHRDCIEKQDLVERLSQDMQDEESMGVIAQSRVDELTEAERSTVNLFARCSPSVAFITVTQITEQRQGNQPISQEVPAGSGSGFVWDEHGHVVTNFHGAPLLHFTHLSPLQAILTQKAWNCSHPGGARQRPRARDASRDDRGRPGVARRRGAGQGCGRAQGRCPRVSKYDEFCITNEKLCIKNEELCNKKRGISHLK